MSVDMWIRKMVTMMRMLRVTGWTRSGTGAWSWSRVGDVLRKDVILIHWIRRMDIHRWVRLRMHRVSVIAISLLCLWLLMCRLRG